LVLNRSPTALARPSRRHAFDDRPEWQAGARQDLAERLCPVSRRCHAPPAANKSNARAPETDQMLGGQGHALAKVGADVVGVSLAHMPQRLHGGNALASAFVDCRWGGAFGRFRATARQDAGSPLSRHGLPSSRRAS
jgi:hypothetical protein